MPTHCPEQNFCHVVEKICLSSLVLNSRSERSHSIYLFLRGIHLVNLSKNIFSNYLIKKYLTHSEEKSSTRALQKLLVAFNAGA